MREISIVLSNIYICNKICKSGAKKQMREGDTILKINLTLPNAKLKMLLALSKQNLRTFFKGQLFAFLLKFGSALKIMTNGEKIRSKALSVNVLLKF